MAETTPRSSSCAGRWQRLYRVYLHTDRRASAAEKIAADAMPEKPAALSEAFESWPGHVAMPAGLGFGRSWTRGQLEEYAYGRRWVSGWNLPHHSGDDETLYPVPEPAKAHARHLLDQLDAWEAERDRIMAPFQRLHAARDSLSDKLTELADRIAVRPSHSWSGLVAKAEAGKAAIDEETGAIEDSHSALMFIYSLLDDICRVSGSEVLIGDRALGLEV